MPIKCKYRRFDMYFGEVFCTIEHQPCRFVCSKCSAKAWCTDFEEEEMENDEGRNPSQD
jgi:hypothetical protein